MSVLPDLTAIQGFLLCCSSFMLNIVLFSIINKLLNHLHKQGKFPGMGLKEPHKIQSDIGQASNWMVSIVQAVGAGILGVVVYQETGGKQMDVPCNLVRWYGWSSLGYWIYDTVCMYNIVTKDHQAKTDNLQEKSQNSFLKNLLRFVKWWPLLVAHHLVIITVVIPGILLQTRVRGDGIIGMSFLMEWSSIFVAWRSCLSRLGFKSSPMYRIVGVLMIIVFFLVRILLLPVAIYLCSAEADLNVIDLIKSLPNVCKIGTTAFYCLNLYWFSLMIIGLKKVIVESFSTKNKQS